MKVTAADVKRFALELDLMPDDVFSDLELEHYALDYLNMCRADDCPRASQSDVEYAHDTQGHTGAVQWCREGACGLTY